MPRISPFIFSWLALCLCTSAANAAVNEERSVAPFTGVVFDVAATLVLTQTGSQAVRLIGEERDVGLVTTQVRGGVLHIRPKRSFWPSFGFGKVRIEVDFDKLTRLEVAGSGDVTSEQIAVDSLKLAVHGSGDLSLGATTAEILQVTIAGSGDLSIDDAAIGQLTSKIHGSGDAAINGRTETQTIEVQGTGSVNYQQLHSQNTNVRIHGSGDVSVWADDGLNIAIHGSGSVAYRGRAQPNQRVHGSGSIRRTANAYK